MLYIVCCRPIIYILSIVLDEWARSTSSSLPSSVYTRYEYFSISWSLMSFAWSPFSTLLSVLLNIIHLAWWISGTCVVLGWIRSELKHLWNYDADDTRELGESISPGEEAWWTLSLLAESTLIYMALVFRPFFNLFWWSSSILHGFWFILKWCISHRLVGNYLGWIVYVYL